MTELEQAVVRLQAGDQEAFGLIYEKTRGIASAVIRKYNSNREEYEDILQETYIKVHQNIGQLQEPGKLQPWLNRIAANVAIRNSMKKNPALFSQLEQEDEDMPLEFEDESQAYNPEAIADKKAVAGIVNEMMGLLPEDQRMALWMVYGQGVKIREMAESLGVSENTIKSRLFQGKKKLLSMKGEFRKRGLEITAIPVGVLLSVSFQEDVYAAVPGAVLGSAAAVGGAAAAQTAGGIGMAGKAAAAITVAALIAVGGYGLSQTEPSPYDNETNLEAVEAYRSALRNEERFQTALEINVFGEPLITEFAVADVNEDFVYEMFVHVPAEQRLQSSNYFLYYQDGELKVRNLSKGSEVYFGVLPGENRFLWGARDGGSYHGRVYDFDGVEAEIAGDYYYDHSFASTPQANDENGYNEIYLRERDKGWTWESQSEIYCLQPATVKNLETYLGGRGSDTGLGDKDELGLKESMEDDGEYRDPSGIYVPGRDFEIRGEDGSLNYDFWIVEEQPEGRGYRVRHVLGPADETIADVDDFPVDLPVLFWPDYYAYDAGTLFYDGESQILYSQDMYESQVQYLYRRDDFLQKWEEEAATPYMGCYSNGKDTFYLYRDWVGYQLLGRLPETDRNEAGYNSELRYGNRTASLVEMGTEGGRLVLEEAWGQDEWKVLSLKVGDGRLEYAPDQRPETERVIFKKTGEIPLTFELPAETYEIKAEVEKAQEIRSYTDHHLGEYEMAANMRGDRTMGEVEQMGVNSYYNDTGCLVKQEQMLDESAGLLWVEAYYMNPTSDIRNSDDPVLTRAVAADGGEYRFYWKYGRVIRYEGADGTVIDEPEGIVPLGFMDKYPSEGEEEEAQRQMADLGANYPWYARD